MLYWTEKYRRIYYMLTSFGHTPKKAYEIILDAHYGDKFQIKYIREMRMFAKTVGV